MDKPVLAWHFLADTGLLRDGRKPPPDGKWLVHSGDVVPCKSGLHAFVRAIDALDYAPGAFVCRVEMGGKVVEHNGGKIVGRRRRILWRADATETLRSFARRQALGVSHLWDAPDVVRRYLETGDESIRVAARVAARATARDAAWDEAWDAAQAAARDAAWDEAWDAARAAAGSASWAASWAAARAAARAAAHGAALDAANAMLEEMLMALAPKEAADG